MPRPEIVCKIRVSSDRRQLTVTSDGYGEYTEDLPSNAQVVIKGQGVFIIKGEIGEIAIGNGAVFQIYGHRTVSLMGSLIEDKDRATVILGPNATIHFSPMLIKLHGMGQLQIFRLQKEPAEDSSSDMTRISILEAGKPLVSVAALDVGQLPSENARAGVIFAPKAIKPCKQSSHDSRSLRPKIQPFQTPDLPPSSTEPVTPELKAAPGSLSANRYVHFAPIDRMYTEEELFNGVLLPAPGPIYSPGVSPTGKSY